jgi:RNA polymerase Rpb6
VVPRPEEFSAFEFTVLAGLRAAQLMRGCTPRVDSSHKAITTALIEVATGRITRANGVTVGLAESVGARSSRVIL